MALLTFGWIRKMALVSAATLALSSCDMYTLEELRHTTPSGTPFQNELSQLYMDYATIAERDYDWFNSWHFADKGLMLAYGKDAPPEDPNDWDIPDSARPEIDRARAELMQVLTPDLMRVMPARTAEAQFYFDCWVKEQDENWREEEIANCRDNLIRALADLKSPGSHENVADTSEEKQPAAAKKPKKPHKVAAVEKPKHKPEPEAAAPQETKEPVAESTSYAVFFEPGQAEVSEPGMNVITEVIKSLRQTPDYVILLHNSKDHPGKAAERIEVVKKLLAAGGLKESAIHVASGKNEGESSKTSGRRVEIFLNE